VSNPVPSSRGKGPWLLEKVCSQQGLAALLTDLTVAPYSWRQIQLEQRTDVFEAQGCPSSLPSVMRDSIQRALLRMDEGVRPSTFIATNRMAAAICRCADVHVLRGDAMRCIYTSLPP
jgi:hypothetical protein